MDYGLGFVKIIRTVAPRSLHSDKISLKNDILECLDDIGVSGTAPAPSYIRTAC